MKLFFKIKENLFSIFQYTLIVLLVVLVVVFVVVMCSKNPEWIFGLLGIAEKGEPKHEALKFLGIGMGGILVALQALMSYKRAKALEDTVVHTEKGQRQERMKNAIEHLGHTSDSVRLGGAYELFHLAEDTEALRQTVLDILCAHIRQTTGEDAYREAHKFEPSEEVQSLLTLLFVQEHEVFTGLRINLTESWLNGADLREARLEKAVLIGAHLQRASLNKAHLQEVSLSLSHLQGAYLSLSHLQGAYLNRAHLQGAYLIEAKLQGAYLSLSHLQGAYLNGAKLQGAYLSLSHLQGAYLNGAKLQGAGSVNWSALDPVIERIRTQIGGETDLSSVIFVGGLSQEKVDSLVKDLPDEKADDLRERLTPHIGQPISYQLPENSGAITGAYTEEEAEKWIAEHEEAMSEIPGNDS